jgi:predicted  nucleic acid-binding Zn-ribbon protein
LRTELALIRQNVHHLSMLPAIEKLLILQERDQKLLNAQRDLEKIPRDETTAKSRLADDTAAVTKAADAVRQCEMATHKIELDIATRRNTINRLKQQQFETRKNEEFTALGNEVIRYEKEIDQLETEELEMMEKADSLRAQLQQAESKLAKSKALVDEDLKDLQIKKEQLTIKKSELVAERSQLAAGVESDHLALYERLIKTKNGTAVVQVVNQMCGGCHMKLVPTTLVKVTAGTELTQCENCGRILFPE